MEQRFLWSLFVDDDTEVQGCSASPLRRAVGWQGVSHPKPSFLIRTPGSLSCGLGLQGTVNEVGCILMVRTEFLPGTAKVTVLTSFSTAPVPAGLTGASAAWREGDPETPGGSFRSRGSSMVSDAG